MFQRFQQVIVYIVLLAFQIRCQQFVSWTSKHQFCLQYLNQAAVTQNKNASTSYITSVHCKDSDYVQYFQQLLLAPPTDYHKSIAEAVLDLYKDLDTNRKSVILDQRYIERNLPNTYRALLKTNKHNTTSTASTAFTLPIYPISFGIPEDMIASHVPSKSKAFCRVIPGVLSTYYKLAEEALYRQDLASSLFTLTFKKHGWDCLRHYELLAAGSLPVFVQIKHCPGSAMTAHPKRLYALLAHHPGLQIDAQRVNKVSIRVHSHSFAWSALDMSLYRGIVAALLQYTRNVLSTKKMMEYVLTTLIQINSPLHSNKEKLFPRRILYLVHDNPDYMSKGDFLVDLSLHGLVSLLGPDSAVIDYPCRSMMYKSNAVFNESDLLKEKNNLYGKGYSYAYQLDNLHNNNNHNNNNHHNNKLANNTTNTAPTSNSQPATSPDSSSPATASCLRNEKEILSNIQSHYYEYIILGSGHRDGPLPFWDEICKHYRRKEVAMLEGGDYGLNKKQLDKFAGCAGVIFSREGYLH